MLNVQGGLGNKQGAPNNNKTAFENFFRGRINNFGRQPIPRFDNADRKGKRAACQMRQLMAMIEAMATKSGMCWCLEELINGEVHPSKENVVRQDQVRAQSEMNQ